VVGFGCRCCFVTPAVERRRSPAAGGYEMSMEELRGSMLVERPEEGYPNWESE
jgi:hypothetical protein